MEKLIVGKVWMVEGVQKDITQGRKPIKPWKGRPFANFDWGYFIPNRYYMHNMLLVNNDFVLLKKTK